MTVSRFPTDNAIYVDENPSQFSVEFLERVFLKNKASYKAVEYRDESLVGGFWSGRAIDKQIGSHSTDISNYWIKDFLASRPTVTPAAGTRRLAFALRDALEKVSGEEKKEISAAAILADNLGDEYITITDFPDRFGLSERSKFEIIDAVSTNEMANERFQFDAVEFRKIIRFRSVELSNGALLTAPATEFDVVFRQETIDEIKNFVRFETEGNIVNDRLKRNA